MESIKLAVKAFIIDELLMVDRELPDGASLQRHGVIDSTGVLELVAFLEARFGITVAYDDHRPENLDTIDAIVGFVGGKLAVAAN